MADAIITTTEIRTDNCKQRIDTGAVVWLDCLTTCLNRSHRKNENRIIKKEKKKRKRNNNNKKKIRHHAIACDIFLTKEKPCKPWTV